MWQSLVGHGKLGLAEGCVVWPASGGPSESRAWLLVLSSSSPDLPAEDMPLPRWQLQRAAPQCHGWIAGPQNPQIMSPAPRSLNRWWQPQAVLASWALGCVGHNSNPVWWRRGHAGWSRTREVPGTLSGSQTPVDVPAPALPCAMGASSVPLMGRGPQIPPPQTGSSAQRWEPWWGSTGTPFLQAQPWAGGSAAGQRCPMSHWPSEPGQEAAGTDSRRAGLPCPSSELQPCGCWGLVEETEDAQTCMPGADTTARAGPTSSWTRVPVPGKQLPKARSAGGHTGLVWEQGQRHCPCGMGNLCRGTTCTQPLQQHRFYTHGGQGWWGPDLGHCTQLDGASPCHLGGQTHPRAAAPHLSVALLQRIGFRSAPPAAAGLQASPPGASGSMGAVTFSAHQQHPGRSHHHGDMFLPQTPSPW